MTEVHYLRAKVQRMVAGMEDTAIVAVEADGRREAVEAAVEVHDVTDRPVFTEDVWGDAVIGDDDRRPATSAVEYLGTGSGLIGSGPVMLSEVEGEKVATDGLE